ncbi:MAG: MotA/TolQ/ExbB proton channel family protein [Bacillota bacterium]
MIYNSLLDLVMKGGFTIFVLIFCSILSLKVVIEKFIVFQGIKGKNLDELREKVLDSLASRDAKSAIHIAKFTSWKWLFFTVKSPLSGIYTYIFENYKLPKEELMDKAYRRLDRELVKLEKGLGILSTLGSISPFIGLFGTVIGIIRSFQALSVNEASSYLGVMSGIAEALISTAAGLLVAVPAVMFYNYFIRKIKLSMPLIEDSIAELIGKLKLQQPQSSSSIQHQKEQV